jgi:hypothetical protein
MLYILTRDLLLLTESGKRQTRLLVRESAPPKQACNCLTVIKNWTYAQDGCFIPKQTGRLNRRS